MSPAPAEILPLRPDSPSIVKPPAPAARLTCIVGAAPGAVVIVTALSTPGHVP